ncbi:hypothetical protein AC578_7896 [Pseudocercospora eumusae]|uniref:RPEL repeat protein n=1 Tax=Pseudocercospora eumusae TaxID=321146 RepID=A0A139HPG6_9PEZI|nr:hypothetical protein AC578_7896 [Pseudocercospora eumusae]
MASNPSEAGVESTSPSMLERRNSLEKHLQRRPDEQDLKDRHILLDTTAAPALQARQQELERQRITDNLKKVSAHGCDSDAYDSGGSLAAVEHYLQQPEDSS